MRWDNRNDDDATDRIMRDMDAGRFAAGARERRRMLAWLVLSVLAALLAWFGFRGYLNPELLFHFANGLYC
jgi:hypothetical protein